MSDRASLEAIEDLTRLDDRLMCHLTIEGQAILLSRAGVALAAPDAAPKPQIWAFRGNLWAKARFHSFWSTFLLHLGWPIAIEPHPSDTGETAEQG